VAQTKTELARKDAFREWVRTSWAIKGGYIRSHSDRQMEEAKEAFVAGWNAAQQGDEAQKADSRTWLGYQLLRLRDWIHKEIKR